MKKIEQIARIICLDRRHDPDELEPGDLPRKDGICPNGDIGHFMWREYAPLARKILRAIGSQKCETKNFTRKAK